MQPTVPMSVFSLTLDLRFAGTQSCWSVPSSTVRCICTSTALRKVHHSLVCSDLFYLRLTVATHTALGVANLGPEVLNGTFEDLRTSVESGPLYIMPSVISTNYLCSVPRMKSTGSIFISILLADLVLLNAVWVVYCLIVGWFFLRSPTANYCEGCINIMHELQPLRAIPKSNASPVPKLPVLEFESASSTNGYEPVQLRRAGSSESLVGSADQPGRYSLR